MSGLTAATYQQFFERTLEGVQAHKVRLYQLAVALFLCTVLLVWLNWTQLTTTGSGAASTGLWVVLYVAVLLLIGLNGLHIASRAMNRLVLALEHLQGAAEFLRGAPSRDAFVDYISSRIDPHDKSNVPEAMHGLAAAQNPSEHAHMAALRVVAPASSELAILNFMRTTMVLAGLLGTVLFFSQQLRVVLNPDNLVELSAALLSTMTGILGALATGFAAGHLETVLDECQWEADAFFSGVVATALARDPAEGPITNERELWESVRQSIVRMMQTINASNDRMAAQALEFTQALQGLEGQLRNIPAITVPPAFETLGDSVDRFDQSTKRLAELLPPLVDAAGKLEILLPRSILERVAEVRHQVNALSERLTETSSVIDSAGRDLRTAVADVRAAVDKIPPDVKGDLHALGSSIGDVQTAIDAAEDAASKRDEAQRAELSHIDGQVQAIRDPLAETTRAARETSELARSLSSRVEVVVDKLASIREWLRALSRAPLFRILMFPVSRTLRGDDNHAAAK